jgi:hypothetical protein
MLQEKEEKEQFQKKKEEEERGPTGPFAANQSPPYLPGKHQSFTWLSSSYGTPSIGATYST